MLLSWPKGLWPMVFYGAYVIYDIVLYIKHSGVYNIYTYVYMIVLTIILKLLMHRFPIILSSLFCFFCFF